MVLGMIPADEWLNGRSEAFLGQRLKMQAGSKFPVGLMMQDACTWLKTACKNLPVPIAWLCNLNCFAEASSMVKPWPLKAAPLDRCQLDKMGILESKVNSCQQQVGLTPPEMRVCRLQVGSWTTASNE